MTTHNSAPTNATTSDRLTTVLSYGVLLLLIYLVFRIYEPFLSALGWAAILVIFFYPMHERLVRKSHATKAADTSTVGVPISPIVPASPATQMLARDLISASVTTSLIIAAIQGILGGLGFAIVKLPTPLFWGVAMAFCSLVPVVGSGLIFVPASLWLGFTGHWGRAILLLAICAGVSTIVDNVLRPLLLGGRTELSGLVIFISVVGGVGWVGIDRKSVV